MLEPYMTTIRATEAVDSRYAHSADEHAGDKLANAHTVSQPMRRSKSVHPVPLLYQGMANLEAHLQRAADVNHRGVLGRLRLCVVGGGGPAGGRCEPLTGAAPSVSMGLKAGLHEPP